MAHRLDGGGRSEGGEHSREYVRCVEFGQAVECEKVIEPIFSECLKCLPIYFVNMVGVEDEAAQWILSHSSVMQGEVAF